MKTQRYCFRGETCFGPNQVATMMKTTLWRNFQVGRLSSSKSGRQKTEMLPQFYRGEDGLTKTDSSVRNQIHQFFLLAASMTVIVGSK